MQALTNSRIETEYRARTTRSAQLYAEACKVIPAGLTHDSRTLLPYPVYAARAGKVAKGAAIAEDGLRTTARRIASSNVTRSAGCGVCANTP